VDYETDGDRVHIRVSDTGIGIPPGRLAAIFDPFVQADRVLSRPHDGVGLGLSIGRELARGMDGDLAVESTVGSGSTFTLTLPSAAPALPPVLRDPLAQASAG
jgi:signal transduction histidine kinase